jgi:ubiquinol-cytochrome c reductase iron-sulfur subunit
MSNGVDSGRRRFLTASTVVVGGVGAVAGAVPFVAAWLPSARAKAIGAPVEIDISKLQPGGRVTVEWRGKPVWVVRRSDDVLAVLPGLDEGLRDPGSEEEQQPGYARNEYRSIKPEYLVLVGICTHLGCSPAYVTTSEPHALGNDWKGGFFCPCHGSRFDLAGRVFKNVPAPTNLPVPPHTYLDDTTILIGVDPEVAS